MLRPEHIIKFPSQNYNLLCSPDNVPDQEFQLQPPKVGSVPTLVSQIFFQTVKRHSQTHGQQH